MEIMGILPNVQSTLSFGRQRKTTVREPDDSVAKKTSGRVRRTSRTRSKRRKQDLMVVVVQAPKPEASKHPQWVETAGKIAEVGAKFISFGTAAKLLLGA